MNTQESECNENWILKKIILIKFLIKIILDVIFVILKVEYASHHSNNYSNCGWLLKFIDPDIKIATVKRMTLTFCLSPC